MPTDNFAMPTPLPPFNEEDRHISGIPGTGDELPPMEAVGDHSLVELPDGDVDVVFEDEFAEPLGFQANLAEHWPSDVLKTLASDLCDQVERDRESRSKRDKQYEEGLRRTGLGDDAPGGAEFSGASRVVHPALAESCVDFASRAIKELFPPAGPVKTAVEGVESEAKIELATRKAKFLNWQLRKQMREYRSELEQILTQLPMGGSQYQKFWYDERKRRQCTEFVPIDDVLLPYAVSDFYSSQRVTHVQHITAFEFSQRVESGLYRDIATLALPADVPELTAAGEANDKIEGRDVDPYNEDGLRDIYEIYVWHEFEEDDLTDGAYAPYIITVDVYNEEILAIYRNWEEGDATFQKLDWMVEWKFIPWRGAYALGFPHLIGGLSGAATGALRALMDSAHINNAATLVKLRGGKTSGQNIEVDPTQVAEIEGPAGADDIRKVIMPMPYNQPSPVLFQLLGWLTDAAKGVIATAEDKMDNIGDRTPVGTTQAMIEQGSQTYSSIHSRLHYSQEKALEIICRINKTFLDEQVVVQELGGLVMSRQDFASSEDISPVSDPEIFSEAQRFAQNQGILQLRSMFNGQNLPPLNFNDNAIARRMLRRMRIENIDEILPEPPKPQNLNPTAENVAAIHGTPILALPQQNHLAHIFSHVEFCLNPVFANPIMGKALMGTMVKHLSEHIGFYYADLMAQATNFDQNVAQMPTKQLEDQMARANAMVLQQMQAQLGGVMQKIQQIAQMAQQFTPPPPVDPAVDATFKAAMAKVEADKEVKLAELNVEREHKLKVLPGIERSKQEVEIAKNRADNQQKHVTELLKNQGDNQTKQWIAAMQVNNEAHMAVYQSKIDQQEAKAGRDHEASMAKATAAAEGGTGGMTVPEDEDMNQEQFDALQQANAETNQKLDQLTQVVAQLAQVISAPKQVVRDQQGKVVGVQIAQIAQAGGNNGGIQ